MAKPKPPKKNHEANEKESKETLISAVPPMPGADVTPAESVPVATAAVTATEPRKIMARKTTRKPEIVKTESRSNLIPINIEDEIRQLAYLFSERRGFTPGHETEDWLAAEHEVMERYHQHSA
jgi:hypothetical protein